MNVYIIDVHYRSYKGKREVREVWEEKDREWARERERERKREREEREREREEEEETQERERGGVGASQPIVLDESDAQESPNTPSPSPARILGSPAPRCTFDLLYEMQSQESDSDSSLEAETWQGILIVD